MADILRPIRVDGLLDEWLPSDRLDRAGAVPPGYALYGISDTTTFSLALSAPIAIGANTTIWLNTDRNAATGYQVFGFAGGAEYNINFAADGTASLYTGGAGQTLVQANLAVGRSTNGAIVEVQFAKSAVGNPQAIDLLLDVNDSVFLPTSYSDQPFTLFADTGIVADAGKRVGIVYSETTAKAFFSETAYSQLFMNAQSQVMQAGLPFDILTEADLTSLATLAKYDTLVFPSFRNVQAAQAQVIANTLEQATKQFGIGLVAAGEFMTNAADGSALAGDSYARMKLLFDVTRVTGGFPADVTLTATDANRLVLDNFAAGETIRQYTGVGWNAFASVSGSGTTIATETIGGQTYAAAIATQTGGRNVIFSSEAVAADSNLLWQAVDYSVNGAGPSVGLQMTRQTALFASRNDMDQSQYLIEVNPAGTALGIYDKLLPIVEQWKKDYNFVGSYYVNVGNDPINGSSTDWTVSGAYYKRLLDLGNELGTHSYTHPDNTNLLTAAQVAFEFAQSKAVIEQQMSQYLGRAFTVDGAAVPGAPETLATSLAILAATTATATGPELVSNGNFSAGATGWTNSAGRVEVGSAATYGVTTAGAGNVLELDADGGSAIDTVSQTVATQAGQSYSFRFDAAQRAGTAAASNTIQVLWNGAVIDTVTPTSTAFAAKSYTVTAAGSTSTLAFRELGGSDSLGGIIDNVSVQLVTGTSKLEYLSGGYSGVGAGYVSGSGYLKPGMDQVYIAPNVTFDFTLIGFQGKTPAQAEAAWAAEWAALTAKAEAPVIVWPWHDYGPTLWDVNGDGAASPYTQAMFTNFIARAYAAGAEFVTLDDLAQRTESLAKATVTSTVVGDVITATVGSSDAGRFALDVDGQGAKVIKSVEGWYAYDADSVFTPANGGTFKITLGAAQDDVTRITALPMRASLISLSGDGRDLAFSVVGEGKVAVDLAAGVAGWVTVTGATVTARAGELLTLDLGANTRHDVQIREVANTAPVLTANNGNALSLTVAENVAAVTTLTATDADLGRGDTIRYAIGGADAALFTIDATSGALRFKDAPDFEMPADVGRDGTYNVVATVTDMRGLTDTQAIAVRVTDVAGVTRTGTSRADTLVGTSEADTLSGLGGRDTLNGAAGADILVGGQGGDYLTGGAGNDTFRFLATSDSVGAGSDRDMVLDFVRGQDKIDLSAIDANTTLFAWGDQAFTLLPANASFTGPGQLRYSYTFINGVEHTIVQGNVDYGSSADFAIALVGRQVLTANDFIL